jgi:hypothetical protein
MCPGKKAMPQYHNEAHEKLFKRRGRREYGLERVIQMV